jgi:hypothetical protein
MGKKREPEPMVGVPRVVLGSLRVGAGADAGYFRLGVKRSAGDGG